MCKILLYESNFGRRASGDVNVLAGQVMPSASRSLHYDPMIEEGACIQDILSSIPKITISALHYYCIVPVLPSPPAPYKRRREELKSPNCPETEYY